MAANFGQNDSHHAVADAWLAEFVLCTLPAEERGRLERHLSACPTCAAEGAGFAEALGALPFSLASVAPAEASYGRLLLAFQKEQREAGLTDPGLPARLAQLFDISMERAREALARAADPAAWGVPGMAFLPLQGGPAVAGAYTGLVRLSPGLRFPRHRHVGQERTLLLQGSYRDQDGLVLHPGDGRVLPAGSEHDFRVLPGDECIFATVVFSGIEILPLP